MMALTLEAALRAYLLGDPSITSHVQDRIAYAHVPESYTLPYIYYRGEGTIREDTLSTALPPRQRYAIECWHTSPAEAIALREAVRTRLHYATGTLAEDVSVQRMFVEDAGDDYLPGGTGSDEGLYSGALIVEVVP